LIQVNSELALLSISWSMKDKRYTTNGLARAAGCTRKALRVYQAQGLMKRPEKTWQACFDQHAVDRRLEITCLVVIRIARKGGAGHDGLRTAREDGDPVPSSLSTPN